ncbi:MAG: hypothetical protein J6K89_07810 [Oscillospiraceae bacterium]|nr:hypothetical protein [Oscillospiraceae bacterium]
MNGETNPWWERSGLTPPEEGGKEQELAEPAENTGTDEGGKEQEPAEPAVTTEPGTNETNPQPASESPTGAAQSVVDPKSNGQSPEQNRSEAQKRRTLEREMREQQIRDEEAKKHGEAIKKIFASLGLKDTSGKPIETMEAYEQYQSDQRMQKMRRDLKAGQLTPESLQEALLQIPQVQGVIQRAEDATKAAQKVEQDAKAAQYRANMESELAEIRKLNPQIKTTDDIIRMETGPEYARLIRIGVKPSEAYKIANFDSIRAKDRAAAEQAARNAVAGKAHIQSSPTAAGNPLTVPADYARNMRRYIPGISDAEIAKYYKQFQSQSK